MKLKQIAKYTTATLGVGSVSTIGPVLGAYFGGRSEVNYHLTKEQKRVDKLERNLQTQKDNADYYFWLSKETNRHSDNVQLRFKEMEENLNKTKQALEQSETKIRTLKSLAGKVATQIENDFGSISSTLRWNRGQAVQKLKEIKEGIKGLTL